MNKLAIVAGVLVSCLAAMARPHYLHEISQLKPDSRLTQACGICHLPGKEFTPEGIAFQQLQFELGVPSSFELWEQWFATDPDFDRVTIGEQLDRDHW